MKRFFLLTIVVFLFITVLSNAEDFWKKSDVIVNPTSIWNIAVTNDDVIFASTIRKLLRSTDLGNSWETITLEGAQFIDHVYPNGKIECNKDGDLFVLTDKALLKLKSGQDTAKIILYLDGIFNNELSMSFSKDNKKIVVLADNEIWVSNDYGNSWEQILLNEFQRFGLYLRSLSYDENFGIIINFGTEDSEFEDKFVYHSIDDGKTWYQLKTIPGTDITIDHVTVGDENLWLVGTNSYNFTTKQLNPIGADGVNSFYSTDIGYFATDYYAFYFSGNEGESWIKTDKSTIFGEGLMWLDAFYVTSSGDIYVGNRYKKFKYSTDKGLNWVDIKLVNEEEVPFGSLKYVGGKLYATDNTHNYFVSEDNGKSWTSYPLTKAHYYTYAFDVNIHGEMVYDDGANIYYSPDEGSSWIALDTTGYNRVPRNMLRIFDNGKIICQGDYIVPFVYDDPYKPGRIVEELIHNLHLLNNGYYLNFAGQYFQLYNEEFQNIGNINSSINSILGYNPGYSNFAISKDGAFYVSTKRGIFKSNSVSDNFQLLAFKDTIINQIFIDDNNFLYISIGQRILMSKDDGVSWSEINSNMSISNIERFLAFGDAKLIAKSDKAYYADYKEFQMQSFLTLDSKVKAPHYAYNDQIEVEYEVRNNLGNAVESAEIFILNLLTNEIDTLISDENGKANYVKTISYYNQNAERNLRLTAYATKENNYKSANISTRITYISQKTEFKCLSDSNIVVTKPGNDVGIRLSLVELINNKYEFTSGSLQIKDYFSDKETTITFNGDEFLNYQINVPNDSEYGIYEIRIKGIKPNNQITNDLVLNLLIVDTIPRGILTSDIKEEIITEQIRIFPNPATEYIEIQTSEFLETSEVSDVQIFNTLGECVITSSRYMHHSTGSGSGNFRIDISHLPHGVYYVRVSNRTQMFVKM